MNQIRTFLSMLFLLFHMQAAKAQFPCDIPYESIQPPNNIALPGINKSVVDYSVPNPIKITKVTEPHHYVDGGGNPQVWYPLHEYAKTQVWNSDQSKYKIASWKVYNAATHQEIQALSGMYPSYWSNTTPDVLWSFRDDGAIKRHHISTNTTLTVAKISGYEYVKLGPGEANIDNNDHYVALVGKKTNNDLDIIVFDLWTNQITQVFTFANGWGNGPDFAPQYIDWVSVSQSGNYVVVLWSNPAGTTDWYTDQKGTNHYGVEVYDRVNMKYQRRIAPEGNHGDLGYAMDGEEVFVQFTSGKTGVYMQKLNGQGETLVNAATDFTASGHISCRNIKRPGWAYVTIPAKNLSGQIVAVKLDKSNLTEHFGHHFSSNRSYDQSPMAVSSPSGDRICFKSDFGTAPNDGNVAYSFFATLNSTLYVEDRPQANVNVYPNPTSNFINLESDKDIKRIVIYNATRQTVRDIPLAHTNSTRLDVTDLLKGLYLIRVCVENKDIIQKVVIE